MKPGPKAKSDKEKALEGVRPSRRARPAPKAPPRAPSMPATPPSPPPQRAPSAPASLSPEGRVEWRRLAPRLTALGRLQDDLDRQAFYALCEAWSRYLGASKEVAADGVVLVQRGRKSKHPGLQVIREAETVLLRLWAEFGLTPSARGDNMSTAEPEEEDELERLLRRP
jgi:P27 family predicted phage terminase small subunit